VACAPNPADESSLASFKRTLHPVVALLEAPCGPVQKALAAAKE
jgi:hypothetical protein